MKMFAGSRRYGYLLLTFALLLTTPVSARITADVDRTEVALGETLRLTLRADDGEQPDEIDFSELEANFRILQRSSATNARIVGGQQSVTRSYELEIAPKRDGVLAIPAFRYDGRQTTPIAIQVSATPKVTPGVDQIATFTAEVSKTELYVQAQTILTITLQQSINLDNRAVSELDIPNTYIEPLEQKTFQRTINGQVWLVSELRYALFPQQSGTLTIPAITFSGRELLPGRSLLGARLGKSINLQTQPITLTVKPVPAAFPGTTWLPARRLELSDSWSAAPGRLNVGDSSTRTIELVAEGLQGTQLPPLTSLEPGVNQQGLRFYPDKETVENAEIPTGLEGYRLQSEALVVTEAGQWMLPERVIPWWNTETDQLEYARLPAVSVNVAGTAPKTSSITDTTGPLARSTDAVAASTLTVWQVIATVGWLLALVMAGLWWQHRPKAQKSVGPKIQKSALTAKDLMPLRLACKENNPRAARAALLVWGQRWLASDRPVTLDSLIRCVNPELREAIAHLDRAAFGAEDADTWQGDVLFNAVRAQSTRSDKTVADELALYPSV